MCVLCLFKQKTAYDLRISAWSSDVCSSDLVPRSPRGWAPLPARSPGVGPEQWGRSALLRAPSVLDTGARSAGPAGAHVLGAPPYAELRSGFRGRPAATGDRAPARPRAPAATPDQQGHLPAAPVTRGAKAP